MEARAPCLRRHPVARPPSPVHQSGFAARCRAGRPGATLSRPQVSAILRAFSLPWPDAVLPRRRLSASACPSKLRAWRERSGVPQWFSLSRVNHDCQKVHHKTQNVHCAEIAVRDILATVGGSESVSWQTGRTRSDLQPAAMQMRMTALLRPAWGGKRKIR